MSQISPPIRILLVASIVLLAAWFTVLKPKEETIPPATTAQPGAAASDAGSFSDTAKAGAATAEKDALGAANANIEDDTTSGTAAGTAAPSTTGTPSATATQAGAAPAVPALDPKTLRGLPAAVRDALEERKVVVLGVLNQADSETSPMADDDRAVRNALRDVNRYGGGVVVRTAPIGRLAKYDGLLKSLGVTQSPTVVVVDRDRVGLALTGYVDRISINQAIADARRSSLTREVTDAYLRKVNAACGRTDMRLSRWSYPTVEGATAASKQRKMAILTEHRATISGLKAPAKWRGLKSAMLAQSARDVALLNATYAATLRGDVTAHSGAMRRHATASAPLDRRYNRVGLTACAENRTR